MSELYDKNGIWIPHHVSKNEPCIWCGALVDTAHTNYCPNQYYLKDDVVKCCIDKQELEKIEQSLIKKVKKMTYNPFDWIDAQEIMIELIKKEFERRGL